MSTPDEAAPKQQQPEAQPFFSRPLLLLLVAWLVMLYFRDQQPSTAPGSKTPVVPHIQEGPAMSGPVPHIPSEVGGSLNLASTAPKTLSQAPLNPRPTHQVSEEEDEFSDLGPPITVTAKKQQEASSPLPPPTFDPQALHHKFLERRYPLLQGSITGGTYPPPPHAQVLASIAGVVQLCAFALMFLGGMISRLLGFAEPPAWLASAQENKMMVIAGSFLFNAMAQSLSATGAFEVYLDEEVVFSKLATGRMPSANDIIDGMRRLGMED